MMVKRGASVAPFNHPFLPQSPYNHTELKFLFKLVVSAYGNHAPPLTLPKKIDFGKKKKKKA